MLGQLAELPQRGRTDSQQLAHFAGPVDRPRRDPLGQQQGVKLTFGLRQEVEGGETGAGMPLRPPETVAGAFNRPTCYPGKSLSRIVAS
ncbi:MAG: hypothetical protein IPL59_16290 [Candidatus Competibacteraceae bacterium]|nr:hypothetical protein [Candidatus Competibacteraceae bacterium]